MVKGNSAPREKLDEESPGLYPDTLQFHMRCVRHIINLPVENSMSVVHNKISNIKILLNALRTSVKCRDLFDEVENILGLKVEIPALDVKTHSSSTFTMVKRAFQARRVLDAVAHRIEELSQLAVSEVV